MRSADVTPLSVVYEFKRGKYGSAHRTVVLSTRTWLPEMPVRGMGITGYRQVRESDRYSRNLDKGWLVLVNYGREDVDLAALAAPTLAVIEAGGMPIDLPDNVRVTVVPAAQIVQTWADFEAEEQRLAERRLAREDALAQTRQADDGARQRLTGTLGEDALLTLLRKASLTSPGAWVALEKAMDAYHVAQTDAM